ncbi:glycosyltransferase family A protein [Halomonas piscis]|uniref:glycosyltransferase family A protein n=1 Tax=Halomonas piscis TaxID=3031727 RepID=UPI0028A1F33B|nr:glycosyltransferase family A protein [Halomonas piscis]
MSVDQLKESAWFDGAWYQARYPDVAMSGMAPERHYLTLGEGWGRRPGPEFDPVWYLDEYPDVARAGISPLLHFIRHGEGEGRLPVRVAALEHEQALWRQHAGDPAPSLAALEALLISPSQREASYAAWALARWYAWRGDWTRVAELLTERDSAAESLPQSPAPRLLEVEALIRLERFAPAAQRLTVLEAAAPEYHDAALARANLLAARALAAGEPGRFDAERLALINGVWRRHDLAQVGLANIDIALGLDALVADQSRSYDSSLTVHNSSLITVIVPAFNAETSLPTALASLAAQRGVTLEVIVVDDASTDGTAEVAEAFAAHDARFRLLRQPFNQGAYAARNRGLAAARGELITVHDSDDWSHPGKLAVQAQGLEAHPEWMACNSHWVRCTPALVFGHWRLEQGWIYRNTSSLMFRRRVFDTLGFWDRVRVDADTEYYYRIRAAFGGAALGEVLPGVPLAFGRSAAQSLSQAGPTHLVTQFAGVRRDYQQAALAWHRNAADGLQRLYLSAHPDRRPFTAPAAMLP